MTASRELARSVVMRWFAANFCSVALVEFKLDWEVSCPACTLNGATFASTWFPAIF